MNDLRSIDLLWVLLCVGQVLLMQAGFCLLESGTSRAKNSINVAIKNLVDFCISALAFWAVGFGLMYGQSVYGWFGESHFILGGDVGPGLLAFFLFQVVFCGTATTIISGAVAERIRFRSYVIVSLFVSAIVYPIFGHWAWGGAIEGTGAGWLAELGFIDFAGSTVVHSVGAWVSLASVIIVGPRLGRFGSRQRSIQSSNLPMVVLGVLVLWFGWLGFNGGSGLALNDRVPLILINTVIAAASGGLMSLVIVMHRLRRPDVSMVSNGVIAGLVAITAGCHLLTPATSIVVGGVAAWLCYASTELLKRLRIDDVIGAIPAHGIAGVWGTLALALLSDPVVWNNGNDRMAQLAVQAYGCAAGFAWAFGLSFVFLWLVNKFYPLRVPHRHEYIGLNIAEHQANSEFQDLLTQMSRHRKGREFGHRVKVEPFTEIGQIAAAYNRVIAEVDGEIACRLQAQQQYQSIFDHAVEGIYQTYPDGSIRSANPALAAMCGYDSPEALCEAVATVATDVYVSPDSRDRFLREIGLHDRVTDFRAQLRRPDGSTIWISENARAVRDAEGDVLYFEGTIVDITQRLASEDLRVQKEQAEAASTAKSGFLAGMSHEMRTPLNGIVSMLELMEEGELSQQQSKYLQIAKRSSTTLLAIINDILDLSKIEAGRLELESVPFSLLEVVDETVEMLYHRAKSKGLNLSAHFDADVPEILIGDAVRLQQVLINLINNAVKFTLQGGVSVSVKIVRENNADKSPTPDVQDWLRIEVADTGIGIEEARQPKIFDAFTQADASTTRRFGGSGLGLNICQQLVEAMGGQIGVESQVDVGSKFYCTIPAIRPEADFGDVPLTNILQHRSDSRIAGKDVLLIAPDNGETDVIYDYLERWGANCRVANSVVDAQSLVDAIPASSSSSAMTSNAAGSGRSTRFDLLVADTQVITDAGLSTLPRNLATIGRRVFVGEGNFHIIADAFLNQPVRPSALLQAIEASFSDAPRLGEIVEPVKQSDDELQGKGKNALVVDDNEINTTVAAELLNRLGFHTDAVLSAEAAITLARENVYDVILMDCEMPDMDGFEATRQLRQLHQNGELALPPSAPLRIIAVTAQALAGQIERCFRSGMNAHLAKPISRTKFARTLRDVFDAEPIQENAFPANGDASCDDATPALPTLDWDEVVQRCGGCELITLDVMRMFHTQLPEHFSVLKDAIGSGDLSSAGDCSHRLKGVAATMAAVPIATLASSIEMQIRGGETTDLSSQLVQLESEVDRCLDWIETKLCEVNQ